MVKIRVGELGKLRLHALFLSITYVLMLTGLCIFLLLEMISFVEFVALFVAFLSLFIVWGQHIGQLKREYAESAWYQFQLLLTLNNLVVWMLIYVAVKHEKWEWVKDIHCLFKWDNQREYDVKRLSNLLAGTHENFQLDMSVLQNNHYIPPNIRDLNAEFRYIIRSFFALDHSENHLPIVKEHIGKLLSLEWWLKKDAIKAERDKLSELNTMLDKMTKEL